MIGRATAIWVAILACAFANGALRELVIAPVWAFADRTAA